MNTQFFDPSLTMEEAKSLYRKLAIENHPDHGGDLRAMQEINAQFAVFCSRYAYNESKRRQAEAHKEGRKSAADYHDMDELSEELRRVIEAALNLGVNVELIEEIHQRTSRRGRGRSNPRGTSSLT